jgi:hypothetical protein
MKSAATAAANYSASAPRAATAWAEGIQTTQKDQASLAVAAIPRMVQGFNDAANSGRIAAGLQRGGTAYWKQQSQAKQGAFSLGIQNGAGNFAVAIGKILSAEAQIVNSLGPRGDIMTNLQRSQQFALGLHSLKGQLGAR